MCGTTKRMEIHVGEPWYHYILSGEKPIEGRLNKGKFGLLQIGDKILINDLLIEVKRITRYASFEEYLMQEGLARTLPGIKTIEEGVAVYRQFYSEEAERLHGVLAIKFKRALN